MPSISCIAGFAGAFLVLYGAVNAQEILAPRAQPVVPGNYPPAVAPGVGYPQAGGAQERLAAVDPARKLSVGDQVTVEIVEDQNGGIPRVVTAAGELDVPPLGRVPVSGKSSKEAAEMIKTLLERDYYQHATVRVSLDRVSPVGVHAGQVFLSGEIRVGGPLEMMPGDTLTLTNAILKAGGITEWGNRKKVQITRQKKDGGVEKTTVSFEQIIRSGDARQDPVLKDGDRIFVPKLGTRF